MASRQARVASTEQDGWLDREQLIDPRAPRFGHAIVFLLLLTGIGYRLPPLIYAVAVLLLATVGSRFAVEPFHQLWDRTFARVLRPPRRRVEAAPFRFAQVLNAALLTVASGAILLGRPLLGNGLAGLAAILAGLSPTTGFCLGCSLYRWLDRLV